MTPTTNDRRAAWLHVTTRLAGEVYDSMTDAVRFHRAGEQEGTDLQLRRAERLAKSLVQAFARCPPPEG